ncbi:MAG: hypothetical protein US83_C0010G0077 [Candidatus Falkowbacteria bacterium GW2011_GWC2_38_22]|uniref:YdbS-like PH domain-containing protein n=1 Tax=Candidatus Falkowbacteria bacterium GW2011_GWE1_38_31 TaxID=1618638 RepID=A0A0G0JRN0_9BACT|nr:MAG: hypothetical protein US73_C0005G0077 [Candidatus Falkowbacteria bacterium GW2011_GWF2_38_1205]KKQ61042.1 MAG: hypothetical protein US83_C0010G0077 [Candidatus Falkowbacteria bacterium GW2011_GWC2_38_22]KKQ63429.1 MAG: hypothetical protein US84_C0006G0031 [Candidatus Falkowbacteria bacterium GW2011_GWF1_38_22]KKQ65500.1 MAG: hypothetical protein US87_C0007G0077 [Candidatus Falkowbacteria bacterium GW2011_GWE2_38_254]KKQ70193.1 MAG: hypothetical protein US91_C0006G0031 [Candidatus Falkowb
MFSVHNLPNKLKDEVIIKVIRKDLFIVVQKVLFFILLITLPIIFFYIFILPNETLMNGIASYPLIVLGASAYYLFIWVFFVFSFVDYYLDVWIITSERIIDIEQRGFFSRVVSEHNLSKVQDVTSEVHGFFPTILQYGACHVQTAGAVQRFDFNDVPHPERIRNLIIGLVEKKKEKNMHNEKLSNE